MKVDNTQCCTISEDYTKMHLLDQAAGHSQIFSLEGGKIAKPLNPHEADIYQAINKDPILAHLVPKFYGTEHIHVDDIVSRSFQKQGEFIILEDITAPFVHPCVMDIKVGTLNYIMGYHDPEKIKMRKVKLNATTLGKYGFRISGLRVYRPHLRNYLVRKSRFGDSLHNQNDLTKALELFLHDGARVRTELILSFVDRLSELQMVLSCQRNFQFRSSSLLLVYEGDPVMTRIDDITTLPKVDVRLIDFDNTIVSEGGGDVVGVSVGVQGVVGFMKKIWSEHRRTQSEADLGKIVGYLKTQ